MVPLQLTLRNFMSYGDEPTLVDFDDMHVICLSGENGHGKSALLDAITWALWGETRLGKQNHDQLVRIGADEMSVVLLFRNGGEIYRIRRQRSRKSSGNIWELQVQESGGSWRPLTAQGASDTGRVITELLRMSYETFLNSAYLRQGRADEFVRQSANKRKEILAEILDLSRYDELETHARQRMREAADRALDENRAINQIDAELSGAADAPEKLAQVERQIQQLAVQRDELAAVQAALAETRATLNAQRLKLAEYQARTKDLERRKTQHLQEISADQDAVNTASRLIAERARIEQDVARYEMLLQRSERLESDVQRFRSLDALKMQLEYAVSSEKRAIEHAVQTDESELRDTLRVLEGLPQIEQRIGVLEAGQTQAQSLLQRQELDESERQHLKTQFAELAADKKRCDSDIAEAELRLERVLDQNETCSICGSPLPEEKLQTLAEECAARVDSLRSRLTQLKREGTLAKSKIDHLELNLKDGASEIKRLQESRLQLVRLQEQRVHLREQQAREPILRERLRTSHEQLSSGGFASKQKRELDAILPEHATLAGVEAERNQVQQETRKLHSAEAAYARLETAERELSAAQSRQASARALVEEIEVEVVRLCSLAADAPLLDRQIAQNQAERDANQARANLVAGEAQRAERELGRLQSVQERSIWLAGQRTERNAALQAARNDEELYAMLASSFGKRGVQALIIENALPELETDANDLLQRLTDGQMSLTLQTTRQAKSKAAGDAPIETLDIVISDALGSRALEMYSGGESFRISFALRIALSKLLARHAGAQLQTLIIDEGFGTQDARGREKLVDSIMAVQSDFAQIIVITHVDEIKDAFPNRIEVFKTPTGSEVNLIVGAALG